MELSVREAVVSDLELLLGIREAAFREIVEEVREWDPVREREAMVRRLREDSVWVVESEGVACGYFSTALEEGSLWLHNIFVLPEFQSRGVGAWVLRRVVLEARGLGVVLRLRCLTNNVRALAFYEREGLRRTGELESHVYFEG